MWHVVSRSPFGRPRLTRRPSREIFQGVVALGVLVMVIVGSSLANGAGPSPSFETGTEPFTTLECAHPGTQFARVTSPVREGKYAARFNETASDVWSNGMVRCLAANYNTGETTGNDYYYHLSFFVPAGGISDNLLWELHHPSSLYSLPGCGVAPHAVLIDKGGFVYRLFTGNCNVTVYSTHIVIPIPGLNPYPRNQWVDFVVHIRFQEAATGSVEVYYRTGSNPWPSSPQVVRTGVPTMPYSNASNVHNVRLYMTAGLYPGYSGYTGNDTVYIDDVRRETSLAAAQGGSVAASGGATPAAPAAGNAATTFPVTTNLVSGQQFKAGRTSVPWTAIPSVPVTSVEFWIDGTKKWTDTGAPYQYGSSGSLDLTSLGVGNHTLSLRGTAVDGRTTSMQFTLPGRDTAPTPPAGGSTPAATPAPTQAPASAPAAFTVTSNIFDGQHFKAKAASLAWTAATSAAAKSVEFWVDGVYKSTDSTAPYQYGATGVLDLASLSAGSHTLLLKATAADGRTASVQYTVVLG